MRKIEREMIQAIIDRKDFNKANTRVMRCDTAFGPTMYIQLHGNTIGEYQNNGQLRISHQGLKTNTTKSRLNALIKFVLGGTCHLGQRNFEWFLFKTTSKDADTYVTTSTPIPDGWFTV